MRWRTASASRRNGVKAKLEPQSSVLAPRHEVAHLWGTQGGRREAVLGREQSPGDGGGVAMRGGRALAAAVHRRDCARGSRRRVGAAWGRKRQEFQGRHRLCIRTSGTGEEDAILARGINITTDGGSCGRGGITGGWVGAWRRPCGRTDFHA
jgi:hypothetical protein